MLPVFASPRTMKPMIKLFIVHLHNVVICIPLKQKETYIRVLYETSPYKNNLLKLKLKLNQLEIKNIPKGFDALFNQWLGLIGINGTQNE